MRRAPGNRSKPSATAASDGFTPTGNSSVLGKVTELLQVLGQHSAGLPQSTPHPVATSPIGESLSARDLTDALLDRLIRRIPRGGKDGQPGEVCPYTGLNRSAIYELMHKQDKGAPVIKTVTLREKGEKHGARFYYVGSLLRYLDRLAETQTHDDGETKRLTPRTRKHGKHSPNSSK